MEIDLKTCLKGAVFYREGVLATTTKKDLAQVIAAEFGCSMLQAGEYIDAFFYAMTDSLIRGNKIEARGFGSFLVKNTHAKANARNPATGERVYVPARRKVAFKPGKELKKAFGKVSE